MFTFLIWKDWLLPTMPHGSMTSFHFFFKCRVYWWYWAIFYLIKCLNSDSSGSICLKVGSSGRIGTNNTNKSPRYFSCLVSTHCAHSRLPGLNRLHYEPVVFFLTTTQRAQNTTERPSQKLVLINPIFIFSGNDKAKTRKDRKSDEMSIIHCDKLS